MVLLNPDLKGKSRAEMGLKEFKRTEIRSNVMGIAVTITEEVIGRACRRSVEGVFQWNLNKKTSDLIPVVKQSLFKGKNDEKYCDMEKEHKVLQKLLQECFVPKGGGVDHLSLKHKVFLHYFISFVKVNFPRYIFHHMLWALEQSQQKNRAFVPYGRLLFEILHHGGMLEVLKMSKAVNDNQLGTMVGKYINSSTLYNTHLVKEVIIMDTDLQESNILSNLMDNFPPICKRDPPDVRAHYVYKHWKATRVTIKYSDILDTMYGGSLPVASKKRKAKKKAIQKLLMKKLLNLNPRKPRRKRLKKRRVHLKWMKLVLLCQLFKKRLKILNQSRLLNKGLEGRNMLAHQDPFLFNQRSVRRSEPQLEN